MNMLKERVSDLQEIDPREHLTKQWELAPISSVEITKKAADGRTLFHVDTSEGVYALKLLEKGRSKEVIQRELSLLHTLHENHFPCAELLPTRTGDLSITIGGQSAYLCRWVEGTHPESTNATFEKLGDLTGRLHALPTDSLEKMRFAPLERMRQQRQLAERLGLDPAFIDFFSHVRDVAHLPQGVVHTDIGPHNTLEQANGTLVLIDWEDAGVGPLVIDLGWLLEQCLTVDNVFEKEKAHAFLKAYQAHRPFSSEEALYMHDIMLSFALLYCLQEDGLKERGRKRIEWIAGHQKELQDFFLSERVST